MNLIRCDSYLFILQVILHLTSALLFSLTTMSKTKLTSQIMASAYLPKAPPPPTFLCSSKCLSFHPHLCARERTRHTAALQRP